MCYSLWYISPTVLPVGSYRPATSSVHYTTGCNTQASVPEDGQNNFPKHVELIGIINKPLLLHLVSCLYYLYIVLYLKKRDTLQIPQSLLNPYIKLEMELVCPQFQTNLLYGDFLLRII